MIQEIKDFIKLFTPTFYAVLLIILFIIGGYAGYRIYHYFVDEPVTVMSQKQAETVEGVQTASNNAGANIDKAQAQQVATIIREIRTTEQQPIYIVPTTAEKAEEATEKAVKDNKADFAILSDPKNPEDKIDIDKLPKDTPINLNQYNVQAYKKYIRQLSIGRSVTSSDLIIGGAIHKKISANGHYIGIGIDQTFRNNRETYIKLIYSW